MHINTNNDKRNIISHERSHLEEVGFKCTLWRNCATQRNWSDTPKVIDQAHFNKHTKMSEKTLISKM